MRRSGDGPSGTEAFRSEILFGTGGSNRNGTPAQRMSGFSSVGSARIVSASLSAAVLAEARF